ncbi:hypothetical protein DERF_014013 [Dermatophagoides farinae]|uniref:Uncharacterized protein n=1 Tax=Dermatophagoides farinae TaxID=6954 RepID=A0A922L161_DERFA|nr:hypothetical protein DERF_014013 [Dermatophagoides farinae]
MIRGQAQMGQLAQNVHGGWSASLFQFQDMLNMSDFRKDNNVSIIEFVDVGNVGRFTNNIGGDDDDDGWHNSLLSLSVWMMIQSQDDDGDG